MWFAIPISKNKKLLGCENQTSFPVQQIKKNVTMHTNKNHNQTNKNSKIRFFII